MLASLLRGLPLANHDTVYRGVKLKLGRRGGYAIIMHQMIIITLTLLKISGLDPEGQLPRTVPRCFA
jgi:hypothetical protein